MRQAGLLQGEWCNVVFYLAALLVVIADQLSKWWINQLSSNLAAGGSLFELGFFHIRRISNTGAAFGLFQDHSFLLTIVDVIGVMAILLVALVFYRQFPFLHNRLGKLSLGLVLGGSIGNLIDRLRLGAVTDFIDFRVWPAFNIADASITVGVILLAYSLIFLTGAGSTRPDSPSPDR